MKSIFVTAVATTLLLAAPAAGAQTTDPYITVPVPRVSGPIPVTPESHPLQAANAVEPPIDLAARGYTEEEFFISGTGNVYDWEADGTLKTRAAGLPYTTRILVRRPANRDRFSGTVLVDIGNRAQRFDTFGVWAQLNDHLLSNAHIYVGLTGLRQVTSSALLPGGHRSLRGRTAARSSVVLTIRTPVSQLGGGSGSIPSPWSSHYRHYHEPDGDGSASRNRI